MSTDVDRPQVRLTLYRGGRAAPIAWSDVPALPWSSFGLVCGGGGATGASFEAGVLPALELDHAIFEPGAQFIRREMPQRHRAVDRQAAITRLEARDATTGRRNSDGSASIRAKRSKTAVLRAALTGRQL